MFDIDRTYWLGPFYVDLCGALTFRQFDLGIVVHHDEPGYSWSNRVSLYLMFWCVSVGWGWDRH